MPASLKPGINLRSVSGGEAVAKRFVSVGECMIEMAGGDDRLYRMGFAGDTLNTAWYARALLDAAWQVDYVTALGDDLYSAQMRRFFTEHGIGTGHIQQIPGRRPGLYLIHQHAGDRHFTYWRGQAAARAMADDPAVLRAALAGADIRRPDGGAMRLTASIGIAACTATDSSIGQALSRADDALYHAKGQGRNRVEVKAPELSAAS